MTLLSRPSTLEHWYAEARAARTLPQSPPAKPATPTPTPARASAPSPTANTAPVPATATELTREFSDDPAFIAECLAQARTLDDSHKWYSRKMRAERDRLAAQHPNAAAHPAANGGAYLREAERIARAERIPMHEALGRVNAERPDLRIAYIEKNRRAGRARN